MESRLRSQTRTGPGGMRHYLPANGVQLQSDVIISSRETQDWWRKKVREDGTLPPTPLTITDIDMSRQPVFNLDRPATVQTHHWAKNWLVGSAPYYGPTGGWISSRMEKSDTVYVADLLAKTNPARPTVSVPVMIAELIEATTLLKVAFQGPLQLWGSGNLNWKFGWSTLISDIGTLAAITSAIESRIKEFNSLVQKGGVRRNVLLDRCSQENDPGSESVYSRDQFSMNQQVKIVHTSKVWGSVRWRPSRKDVIPTEPLEVFNAAVRHCLDLEVPDPATIWEMIPFSWLVDYFVNIGDVLHAIEGRDYVEPYDICIMRERLSTKYYFASNGVTLSNDGLGRRTTYSASSGATVRRVRLRTCPNPQKWTGLLAFGFVNKNQAMTIFELLASISRR